MSTDLPAKVTFALSYLGGAEETRIREYIASLHARIAQLEGLRAEELAGAPQNP